MSREIKFRMWNRIVERMSNGYTLYDLHAQAVNFPILEVMQYTGFKDKNGVELYEGDIYTMGDKNIKYVVEWKDGGLSGRQIGNKSRAGFSYWVEMIEIIGNIYQRPELIPA